MTEARAFACIGCLAESGGEKDSMIGVAAVVYDGMSLCYKHAKDKMDEDGIFGGLLH